MGQNRTIFLLVLALPIGIQVAATAQSSSASTKPQKFSQYSVANDLAMKVRAGDSASALGLAREAFKNAGIPSEIADTLGFTNRVASAELDYRKGTHASLDEEDVARALNDFATSLGAPDWVHTTPSEVRRLRAHLVVAVPNLFANTEPPDQQGHYHVFRSRMGPTEATYLAVTMLFMKSVNSDYQFTEPEQNQLRKASPSSREQLHGQRSAYALDIVNGRSGTVSLRDIMVAANRLFNELGIPDRTGAKGQTGSLSAQQKGGF